LFFLRPQKCHIQFLPRHLRTEREGYTMTPTDHHETAKLLYAIRLAVGAARSVFAEDAAIAHPVPGIVISNTEFWDDALGEGKQCARPLLCTAHENALNLMVMTRGQSKSELGALAFAIKQAIEWSRRCLDQHGDAPDNMDRMGAAYPLSAAWHLTGAALRVFAIECDVSAVGGGR
jgi:hypothetical protein